MFGPLPDLASDLEWMLQSGQVSRETLAEALVHEHYSTVYRLALALLDDQAAARRTTRLTFANALLEIYRYRPEAGISAWLYGIALETCSQVLKRLNRRRSLQAAIPWRIRPSDLGESQPQTRLDAAAWLAIDAQPELDRQVIYLHYLLDWDDARIAAVLKRTPAEVSQWIDLLRQRLLTSVWQPFREANPENRQSWTERVEQFLRLSLYKRWRVPEQSPASLDKAVFQALRSLHLKNAQRRLKTLSKELALVGATILLVASLLFGLSRLWPEPSPTPLATVLATRLVYVTPTPAQPAAQTATAAASNLLYTAWYVVQPGDTLPEIASQMGVSLESLNQLNRLPPGAKPQPGQTLLDPSRLPDIQVSATPLPAMQLPPTLEPSMIASYILKRLYDDPSRTFTSVWFDALITDYGPPGYIGPAKVTRTQAWFDQAQYLLITGPQEAVEEVWLHTLGVTYHALPQEQQPQFIPSEPPPDLIFNHRLHFNLPAILEYDPTLPADDQNWVLERRENYASRPAILLHSRVTPEHPDSVRIWLDASTGLVLRKQYYHSTQPILLQDIAIQQIVYNMDLPQDLLIPVLPWRGGYAASYRGEPLASAPLPTPPAREPLGYNTALPPFFNPARTTLTLQFPRLLHLWGNLTPVDLFADGYYLGNAYFGDPWQTVCDRSPDGKLLAFLTPPDENDRSYLHWFTIDRPPTILETLHTDPHVRQFAISPDSARLAIFGQYDALNQQGALYILDIPTRDALFISSFTDIHSLLWKPDGMLLAFIARRQPSDYQQHLLIVDTHTGAIISDQLEGAILDSSTAWPPSDWGLQIPSEMDTLEHCALPDSRHP